MTMNTITKLLRLKLWLIQQPLSDGHSQISTSDDGYALLPHAQVYEFWRARFTLRLRFYFDLTFREPQGPGYQFKAA